MNCDCILRNGRLLNTRQGIDRTGDLAILEGKILPEGAEGLTARKIIDVSGCLVLPGLIDIHTHLNYLGNAAGVQADLSGIPMGVTAAVDAGSTGISNCAALADYLMDCETRTRFMLNVSAGGIIMSSQFPECLDPAVWDIGLFDEAFARHGDQIVALKLRVSKEAVNKLGLHPLYEALNLAERYGARVCVHTTDPPVSMGEIARLLRSGDILAHMYHGSGNTCLEQGVLCSGYVQARARGVIFDTSCGQGNFSIEVAREAIEAGFLPDTISTDMNRYNWAHNYVYSLPAVLSKFMALGMTLEEVIDCATEGPAATWGSKGELGCLLPGTTADITVLRVVERPTLFQDKFGASCEGGQLLIPELTMINGKVVYQSMYLHP